MKLIIDDLARTHSLLMSASSLSAGQKGVSYAIVSADPVILPDPFEELSISLRSDGLRYSGACRIGCGRYLPEANIRNKIAEKHRDRWRTTGGLNKGYVLDLDRKDKLITTQTLKFNNYKKYSFNIHLGTRGAKPLKPDCENKFILNMTSFQSIIQNSLDAFFEHAKLNKYGEMIIPEDDDYVSLTELSYSTPAVGD